MIALEASDLRRGHEVVVWNAAEDWLRDGVVTLTRGDVVVIRFENGDEAKMPPHQVPGRVFKRAPEGTIRAQQLEALDSHIAYHERFMALREGQLRSNIADDVTRADALVHAEIRMFLRALRDRGRAPICVQDQ